MRIIVSIISALLVTGCMQTAQGMRANEPVDTFLLKGDFASAADCVLEGVNVNTPYESSLNTYNTQQYAEIIHTRDWFFLIDIRPTDQPNVSRGELRENRSVVLVDWGPIIREAISSCLA